MNKSLKGYFGCYGGQFVAETLMPILEEIEAVYSKAKKDPSFHKEFYSLLKNYVGRPSPLYFARRLSEHYGRGTRIYLKREDLNHTGAHKINNTIGQALLATRMKKKRLMAETGAGQHGVATATAAALFGLECEIFMGCEDIKRQAPNVKIMEMLGATIHSVSSGTGTLKDAMSEAIRQWVEKVDNTFYVIGSVAGPHPYPTMVRDFQSIIGRETKRQIMLSEKRLPDVVLACVGGGSNSAGMFYPFIGNRKVQLIGVEAAGKGLKTGNYAASIARGKCGVLHGSKSYVLQTDDGQILNAHSISAGLDYPGVGPEHSYWAETGKVKYESITDDEAVEAFYDLVRYEGIIPALESSHALAYAKKIACKNASNQARALLMVVCLSGRGDKDIETVQTYKKS
jgi:tryptophan synthase beta chain